MFEHDDVGSASTLPPPPPPLLLPSSPPPQPAAAIASTANSPIRPTALTLCFTLPPQSPVAPTVFDRGSIRSGAAGRKREGTPPRRMRRRRSPRTIGAAPKWRNWQTRRTQNPVPFGECGFDSHL